MQEIWEDVEGYEGYYQISNFGRIKSVDRKIKKRNRAVVFFKGKIIKQTISKFGYYRCTLHLIGTRKTFLTSRIVGITFIPNPNNLPQINHKDGIKKNNYVNNLEWATCSENHKHAFRLGLNSAVGEKNSQSKLNEFQVRVIKKINDLSYAEIGKIFCISGAAICLIKKRITWKHLS